MSARSKILQMLQLKFVDIFWLQKVGAFTEEICTHVCTLTEEQADHILNQHTLFFHSQTKNNI